MNSNININQNVLFFLLAQVEREVAECFMECTNQVQKLLSDAKAVTDAKANISKEKVLEMIETVKKHSNEQVVALQAYTAGENMLSQCVTYEVQKVLTDQCDRMIDNVNVVEDWTSTTASIVLDKLVKDMTCAFEEQKTVLVEEVMSYYMYNQWKDEEERRKVNIRYKFTMSSVER